MEAFRRRVAVHPAWWAAACACDGVGWMHLCGTACSHLGGGSVSRWRQCDWELATPPAGWVYVRVCFALVVNVYMVQRVAGLRVLLMRV